MSESKLWRLQEAAGMARLAMKTMSQTGRRARRLLQQQLPCRPHLPPLRSSAPRLSEVAKLQQLPWMNLAQLGAAASHGCCKSLKYRLSRRQRPNGRPGCSGGGWDCGGR